MWCVALRRPAPGLGAVDHAASKAYGDSNETLHTRPKPLPFAGVPYLDHPVGLTPYRAQGAGQTPSSLLVGLCAQRCPQLFLSKSQDRLGQEQAEVCWSREVGLVRGRVGLRVVLHLMEAVGFYVLGQVGRGQRVRNRRVVSW